METHAWIKNNNFLTDLLNFCTKAMNTCFSPDKACIPLALSFFSALLLLLSCLVVVHQRWKFLGKSPEESIIVLYCLLGNLCSTVGATLSRELYIQVLMGACAVVLDAVNCIVSCFSLLLCWNSKSVKRMRMMRRRRRQHVLAVAVLLVLSGGFLKSTATHIPVIEPFRGRKLLRVPFQLSNWTSDDAGLLGYTLGLLSFVIACTSRFPQLCKAYRGHILTNASIVSVLLCSLAGATYAASILLYDTQFNFFMRVLPWLLSSFICSFLDFFILLTYWCRRKVGHQARSSFSDTESLLGAPEIMGVVNSFLKIPKKQSMPSLTKTKKKIVQKMTEMGLYMDINVQPARKVEVEERPLDRVVKMMRVDSVCSSDISDETSVVSSDLEWDFEATNTQWRKSAAIQQKGNEFALQEWPAHPKDFNNTRSISEQKTTPSVTT